uniref:Epidermal patterning factor-like protein n=1 Tax=Solanum tuberosum TaxID=4113 RepID=M1D867_SOLTU
MENRAGDKNENGIEGLSRVGSRPPNCEHRCGRCKPCIAIQVPTNAHHFVVQYANYEPEVGKYPTSFLSQGQVNFGEWIIYNDESLTDFLRVPNDYIDQIKLTILEIYVRKEPKTSQQRSPLSVDVHPRLENRNSVDGFPITQSTDFSNMTHYQNILTGRYDVDLNETINESDWENITQDEPIDPVNIDDRDLPNYDSPSASDSDELPNAEE